VITQESWMDVKSLSRQGMSIRHIARTTGLSRVTVRRALMQVAPKGYGPRPTTPGKITPYEPYLLEQLQARPWVRATTLFHEVCAKGYAGHYEGIKRFVRSRRREEKARSNVCVRFETGPAQEAQFDWKGPIAGLIRPAPELAVFLFRFLLCFSRVRITSVAFTLRLPEVLFDLRSALEKLGGVVHRIVFDNFKAAVLTPRPHLRLQPVFADFCAHYGVEPQPALPYSPQRKGKVERSFGDFVDEGILHRTYESVEELQRALDEDDRRHGDRLVSSTGRTPRKGLDIERPLLLPLPDVSFDPRLPEARKVFSDCTLSLRGARYSVPHPLVGQMVTVKEHPKSGALEIFHRGKLVASHARAVRGERVVLDEHVAELVRARWDRPRRVHEAGATRTPASPHREPRPLVVWPKVSVETRPLSLYDELASEVRP
jgi:transposase